MGDTGIACALWVNQFSATYEHSELVGLMRYAPRLFKKSAYLGFKWWAILGLNQFSATYERSELVGLMRYAPRLFIKALLWDLDGGRYWD